MAGALVVALPTTIQVGPLPYQVTANTPRLIQEHPDWAGMSKRYTLEIVVLEDLPAPRAREILWHEVKHAVADVAGWCSDEHLDEEMAVSRLAPMELAVLRANPALVAFLVAED